MGRIVYDTATTLNGFIADEQNSLAWLFAVEHGKEPDEGLLPPGATVMVEGSTTYEWVLAEEDILAHPEKWQDFHAGKITYVFTTRKLAKPEGADVRFVSGSVADALPAIREAAGDGDIWVVGGGGAVPRRRRAGRDRHLRGAGRVDRRCAPDAAPLGVRSSAAALCDGGGTVRAAGLRRECTGLRPVADTRSRIRSCPFDRP